VSRPQAACSRCGESVDAPDSDLGRAVVAVFEERHRGHCPCAACDPGMMLDGEYTPFPSRMNICPQCGNKRCPKASNHARWQCSGSNDVGQVGVPVAGPKRRLRACVEAWPEAETGEYNPACCRFPKSCSATVYDPERVTDADLEEKP
jgi:hypothetical protein